MYFRNLLLEVSQCLYFEFWQSEQLRHTYIPSHAREGTTSVLTAAGGEGGGFSNANTKQMALQPLFGLPVIKGRRVMLDKLCIRQLNRTAETRKQRSVVFKSLAMAMHLDCRVCGLVRQFYNTQRNTLPKLFRNVVFCSTCNTKDKVSEPIDLMF